MKGGPGTEGGGPVVGSFPGSTFIPAVASPFCAANGAAAAYAAAAGDIPVWTICCNKQKKQNTLKDEKTIKITSTEVTKYQTTRII